MRWLLVAGLAILISSKAHCGESANPLRLVPRQTDVVLRIEPRRLAEAVLSLDALKTWIQFPAVRDALDSTNSRRFRQLIAYYERELGRPWPELLDSVAGGGIVVATKFERGGDAPVLAVIQSRDPVLLRRAVAIVGKVAEQELARNDAAVKPKTERYRDIEVTKLGEAVYAIAESALLISNKQEALQRGVDLLLDGDKESLASIGGPSDADKLLPPDALARLWVSLVPAHESSEGKQIFKQPKNDVAQLIAAGGVIDVIGKSPFLAAGLYRTLEGLAVSVRMPAGRDATPDGFGLHLAPAGSPGSLPPLEPANVLYSSSFYLDLAGIWSQRETILSEGIRKQLDQGEQRFGRFLAGRKISELLTQSGPYHRFVVTAPGELEYSKSPGVRIPAFALATSMRSPEFGQAMSTILRAVAFLTGTQAKLKIVEETVDGVKLVGYRFPENGTLANDTQNLRFNFSPCFASVGDQFFAASTLELGREMIGLLRKSTPENAPTTTVAAQSRLFAAGGAVLAKMFEEQQVTQAILDRAVSPADAKKEVAQIIDWLRTLGQIKLETDYRPHEFRFDARWDMKR